MIGLETMRSCETGENAKLGVSFYLYRSTANYRQSSVLLFIFYHSSSFSLVHLYSLLVPSPLVFWSMFLIAPICSFSLYPHWWYLLWGVGMIFHGYQKWGSTFWTWRLFISDNTTGCNTRINIKLPEWGWGLFFHSGFWLDETVSSFSSSTACYSSFFSFFFPSFFLCALFFFLLHFFVLLHFSLSLLSSLSCPPTFLSFSSFFSFLSSYIPLSPPPSSSCPPNSCCICTDQIQCLAMEACPCQLNESGAVAAAAATYVVGCGYCPYPWRMSTVMAVGREVSCGCWCWWRCARIGRWTRNRSTGWCSCWGWPTAEWSSSLCLQRINSKEKIYRR